METFYSDEERRRWQVTKWEVDEGNSPERREEGEREREVRTGHSVKWKTPDTLEMFGGGGFFIAQLSSRLQFNLSFHCRFSNPLIKTGCCANHSPEYPLPLAWNCPLHISYSCIRHYFFFSSPTFLFLLPLCCWSNHILTLMYSPSRKTGVDSFKSYLGHLHANKCWFLLLLQRTEPTLSSLNILYLCKYVLQPAISLVCSCGIIGVYSYVSCANSSIPLQVKMLIH